MRALYRNNTPLADARGSESELLSRDRKGVGVAQILGLVLSLASTAFAQSPIRGFKTSDIPAQRERELKASALPSPERLRIYMERMATIHTQQVPLDRRPSPNTPRLKWKTGVSMPTLNASKLCFPTPPFDSLKSPASEPS